VSLIFYYFFIPVKLGPTGLSIGKTNYSNSFHLSPTPRTIQFFKTDNLSDLMADGNCFDICDLTDNLKRCHQSSMVVSALLALTSALRRRPARTRQCALLAAGRLQRGLGGLPVTWVTRACSEQLIRICEA
jgi:hypothetical protein